MKIVYISENDSSNLRSWSGLDFFINNSLAMQENVEITTIDKLTNNFRIKLKIKKLLYNLTGRRYQAIRDPQLLKDYALQIIKRLPSDTDCIFAPSSMPIAYLNDTIPVFFYTDATFNSLINYYPSYYNLCKETLKNGFLAEYQALTKAKMVFYASDWARDSAIKHYKINSEKVKTVPFGANLFYEPSYENVQENISKRSQDICNLLFIGVDFVRKGGKLAFEVAQKLNQSGIKTVLHIVGIQNLPSEFSTDFVKNYGYINKDIENEKVILDSLFETSHFLIVPSEAEAYGLVYCEANAFGIPAIGTNTGGISTIIKNGVNGWCFEKETFVEQSFTQIKENFESKNKYNDLAKNAYFEYVERLNWKVSGKKIIEFMTDALK